jgi:GMP synthase (glutamine-hydrolysing)
VTSPDRAAPVLVVDFGGQYAQLVARRVRELGVQSEIILPGQVADTVISLSPAGIILSGSPSSVNRQGAPGLPASLYNDQIPVLGICYGAQLIARDLGGKVDRTASREYGRTTLQMTAASALLNGQPTHEVWMSHGDTILAPPTGADVTARTTSGAIAAWQQTARRLYGLQFHPEVSHTDEGNAILGRFLFDVCGCHPTRTASSIIDDVVERVRKQVGPSVVICALSGGVDSAVAATLVERAVGKQLTCVFVDTGLLRLGEPESIIQALGRQLSSPIVHVNAQDRFLKALRGQTEPERKRAIIGETFIRVFEKEARSLGLPRFLVQGTIFSDVIESGNGSTAKIKSHHNVGGLPEELSFELVEPLRELFKDEVRAIGRQLGLPDQLLLRQPFPGPGLAIRIIGAATPERLEILRRADAILTEEASKAGLAHEVWQCFAVLPAIQSVGVMGDERSYGYPIVIRAVTSEDGMTADWYRMPHDLLHRISSRITNEVEGINRVVYDVTSKPPATIEWE